MQHRIEKFFSLIIPFLLILSLVGCGSTSDSTKITNVEETKEQQENTASEEAETTIFKANNEKETQSSTTTTVAKTEQKDSSESTSTNKQESTSVDTSAKKKQTSSSKPIQTNEKKNNDNASDKIISTEKTDKETTNTTTKSTTVTTKPSSIKENVTIMIIGSKEIGVILPKSKVIIKNGDTVLDVLLKSAKDHHFDVEYSGSGAMAYIEGIYNLYEFDYGPKSGWNFKINGSIVNKSSDMVKVKIDDYIEWIYSEDFTED
jgi:hypothetical protein